MGNSGSSSVASAAGGGYNSPGSQGDAEQHSDYLEGMEAYSDGDAQDADAITGSPLDYGVFSFMGPRRKMAFPKTSKIKKATKSSPSRPETPKGAMQMDNKQVHGSVVVLGISGAGKSTVVQQLRNRRTKFLEESKNRKPYVGLIHELILSNMKTLVQKAIGLDFRWIDYDQRELAEKCAYEKLTPKDLPMVFSLWKDHRLREFYTYESSLGYIQEDSVDYFFDRIPSMTRKDWVPSVDDVMRLRQHTSSPDRLRLSFPDLRRPNEMVHQLTMVDVGGLREQRRSWHHHFDDAAILVFVTSLSDYSCILGEAKTSMNALRESMTLFRSLLHSRWFERHSVVLIFTKDDIFRKKIALDSIGNYFTKAPQGIKGCNYETALRFIQQRYRTCDPNPNRTIHMKVVNAITGDSAELIEEVLQAAIIETGLKIRDIINAREAARAAQVASLPVKTSRLMSTRRGSAMTSRGLAAMDAIGASV